MKNICFRSDIFLGFCRVLCAKVVGATSSEGFLVIIIVLITSGVDYSYAVLYGGLSLFQSFVALMDIFWRFKRFYRTQVRFCF